MTSLSISSIACVPGNSATLKILSKGACLQWRPLSGFVRRRIIKSQPNYKCASADGGAGEVGPSNNNGSNKANPKTKREMLLEYVRNVQPEFLEIFMKRAPPQVVEAMRQTVTNMIGTLPPQFFVVTVTTVAENLAQLMYSVMMTGYMFKNAQYRLELQKSLEQVALTDKKIETDSDYAAGSQKKLSGEVIRWRPDSGPEKIDAVKYIELLEYEIDELKQQLKRRETTNGQNEILDYIKSLEPRNLQELTSSAGEDVLEAMNTFIQRLLGVSEQAQLQAGNGSHKLTLSC
eukprot:TRINITY_DN12535_c0_g1_i2.p1 TRINITY_DN12535_c0_g1~~TRINITY_DN12535_c0_g1_i2.p1  ORF type:complete len:290 (-),score=52.98 TRINITY_DN12535_c0_g1_i2:62-931(-)